MKITKINHSPQFCANKDDIDKKTGEYTDPLMRWPLRGCAFTNEVGEALRPLIGGYATLSWAPALLYIGADVYDKYKNNQTEYSPNSERCLKQAIFQGMASVLLPLVAVKAGQNLFSQLGRLSKDKLTVNVKEEINQISKDFVANGKMRAFEGKDEECKKEFLEIVQSRIDFDKQQKFVKNPIKKIWNYLEEKSYKLSKTDKQEKIKEYAEQEISTLIETRKKLLNPDIDMKKSKIYATYLEAIKSGQTDNVAVKSTLSKTLETKMLKGKFIKTLGGFVALGLAIQPIDHFVEHVLIGKYVNTGIEKIKQTEVMIKQKAQKNTQ